MAHTAMTMGAMMLSAQPIRSSQGKGSLPSPPNVGPLTGGRDSVVHDFCVQHVLMR